MAVKRSSGRGPRAYRNLRPMDADQVVEAAVRLTRAHCLRCWTLRQLAAELGAWPAVIYHHVGDRETVTAAVVDRVLGDALDDVPPADWRGWFGEVLTRLREAARQHHGVAQWLADNGPVVPAMLRLVDRGVLVLSAAGFGDEAPVVYSVLVGAAVWQLAAEDLRDASDLADEDPWWGEDQYAYRVERALDGVAVRLAELR